MNLNADTSIVICAYTMDRWDMTLAAIESGLNQEPPPLEVVLVIDHNPTLFERFRQQYESYPKVTVVENDNLRGLSGARNTGISTSTGSLIAFLDDDAVAEPDWLKQMTNWCDQPDVLGVGGRVVPSWESDSVEWFPAEFYWVFGCSYRGLPEKTSDIRNPSGGCMVIKREGFETFGGFRTGTGRVGDIPLGCEETELSIRAHQVLPNTRFIYEPSAVIHHYVPNRRATWSYLISRCYNEGISKALLAHLVGSGDGLASERTYTMRVLPMGVLRGVQDAVTKFDRDGLGRAAAIIVGLFVTTLGYLVGLMRTSRQKAHQKAQIGEIAPGAGSQVANHNTQQSAQAQLESFKPLRIVEVELSQPLPEVTAVDPESGKHYGAALLVVKLHSTVIGMVDVPFANDHLAPEAAAAAIWREFAPLINAHLTADHLPQIDALPVGGLPSENTDTLPCIQPRGQLEAQETDTPQVTIIICTRDRTEYLEETFPVLLELAYPNYEIIVVDNAPRTNATYEFITQNYGDHAKVRYVKEEHPGLSWARNCGLRHTRSEIVAFTDDDARVDKHWLTELVLGLNKGNHVGCVTGLTLPWELETQAQVWFQQFGGLCAGFEDGIYDLGQYRADTPLYPYSVRLFGGGVNMAFRTDALRKIGGFNQALIRGGEDITAYVEIIKAGYQLVYETRALVYHKHRADYAGLKRQMRNYGAGLTSAIADWMLHDPLGVLRRIPAAVLHVGRSGSSKNVGKQADYPAELNRLEWRGMVEGPLVYLFQRWQLRGITPQIDLVPIAYDPTGSSEST